MTEAEDSTILRLESSDLDPSKDHLPSQVSGEGVVVTANLSVAPTSPKQSHPDASADKGSDIGANRQPIANEPDSIVEPTGKVISSTLERTEALLFHNT